MFPKCFLVLRGTVRVVLLTAAVPSVSATSVFRQPGVPSSPDAAVLLGSHDSTTASEMVRGYDSDPYPIGGGSSDKAGQYSTTWRPPPPGGSGGRSASDSSSVGGRSAPALEAEASFFQREAAAQQTVSSATQHVATKEQRREDEEVDEETALTERETAAARQAQAGGREASQMARRGKKIRQTVGQMAELLAQQRLGELLAQVERVHGSGRDLVSANFATFGGDGGRARLDGARKVASAETSADAADAAALTRTGHQHQKNNIFEQGRSLSQRQADYAAVSGKRRTNLAATKLTVDSREKRDETGHDATMKSGATSTARRTIAAADSRSAAAGAGTQKQLTRC